MPSKCKSSVLKKAPLLIATPRGAKAGPRMLSNMASQAEEAHPALHEQHNFDALMQGITTCQTTLTGKIYSMQLEIGLILKDIDKFRARLTEVECRVGDTEDMVRDHTTSLHALTTKVKALAYRAGDSENHNRRNKLRILGLPEGSEDPNPAAFTEHLLHGLLSNLCHRMCLRMSAARGAPGPPRAPPRTFILCLLNFCDRDLALRESRKIEALRFEGAWLMIFPVLFWWKRRSNGKSFDHVKLNLRQRGLKYSMLFSARL